MELLLILMYTAFCWGVFKIFKLPLNKWTVPTAVLGGVVMILGLLLFMNYNHPYTKLAREYYVTTAIVPDVQGRVIEVPVKPNEPLKAGDVLFRIDPAPYQFQVDRLEASLAGANTDVAQLEQRLRAAEAATAEARSTLLSSESDFDRQARESVEQAKGVVAQVEARLELATVQFDRYKELHGKGVVSQLELDRTKGNFDSATAELEQAQAAARRAAEQLASGGDKLSAVSDALRAAEAQEAEARLAFEAQVEGVNPQVRQISAELDQARWNLERCTTRAPTDGFATQVLLRPGAMAVPLPLRPVMTFVHTSGPDDRALIGAFQQNSLQRIKVGDECEVIFKAIPGRVFKGKVKRVLPTMPQGQLIASGTLQEVEAQTSKERVPVILEIEQDMSEFHLPMGVLCSAAIYTEHMHHLSLLRKILLRMVSWQNYLFGDH